jgi:hypothetical protein
MLKRSIIKLGESEGGNREGFVQCIIMINERKMIAWHVSHQLLSPLSSLLCLHFASLLFSTLSSSPFLSLFLFLFLFLPIPILTLLLFSLFYSPFLSISFYSLLTISLPSISLPSIFPSYFLFLYLYFVKI